MWAWVSGGVYKNWCLDGLEGSFALNLIILAASTYYVKLLKGNKLVLFWVHICHHSICDIHWDPHLPYLPASEEH